MSPSVMHGRVFLFLSFHRFQQLVSPVPHADIKQALSMQTLRRGNVVPQCDAAAIRRAAERWRMLVDGATSLIQIKTLAV